VQNYKLSGYQWESENLKIWEFRNSGINSWKDSEAWRQPKGREDPPSASFRRAKQWSV